MPTVLEVDGKGQTLSTWVTRAAFETMPNAMSMAALVVAAQQQSRYQIGTFVMGPQQIAFILHSDEPVQNVQPQIALNAMLKSVGMQCALSSFESFNLFHLERFGMRDIPFEAVDPTDSDEEWIAEQWDVATG